MAHTVTITIRPYQSGDEESIVSGFNKVFNLSRDTDYWRWKFQHQDSTIASVAVDETQAVQAHIAAHPVTWHCNRAQWQVAHAGDAYSLPTPALIHGRAMLKTLTALHKEQRAKGELKLLFGFPSGTLNALHNTHSPLHDTPKSIRRWRHACTEQDIESEASQYEMKLAIPSPASIDAFWQRTSSRYALLAQRDWKWLNWRFIQRPDVNDYEFLYCKDSTGTLRAWAVLRELEGSLWICDLLWDGANPASLAALLRYTVNIAAMRKLTQVALWLQGDAQAIEVLETLEWQDDSQAHAVRLSMHPYDESLDYAWIRESLYVTKADSDLI